MGHDMSVYMVVARNKSCGSYHGLVGAASMREPRPNPKAPIGAYPASLVVLAFGGSPHGGVFFRL